MTGVIDRLLPRPREIELGAGSFSLGASGVASFVGEEAEVRPARERLGRLFGPGWQLSAGPAEGAAVRFGIVPQASGPQAYRLAVDAAGVTAEAQDAAGLFYAAVTLAQLVRLSGGRVPACVIRDWPDFQARGVMLDISRDKVPTMATLFGLVDQLADLKLNQLQLYTEHAFAYRGHEEVWRDASPVTPDEVRALDRHCRARCVELVPNQNSFGHLERWLTRPRYNGLAELPQGGAPLPWGGVHEKPTSLCPTDPRCVEFLAGLYDNLLPNFTSRQFNVGCDETFDLRGPGRSAALVKEVGEGRVYVDFLKRIHGLVAARGRSMQFWGDIIIRHPELVPEIPEGCTALEWGYEADHPFTTHGALFAQSGVPFYVCPGTSSWNSLAGRTANMVANIRSAAESGLRHGACGLLLTDWGDGGHWQPLAVSLAGFACGAGAAWCGATNGGADWEAALDAHLAEGFGRALLELGDVYRLCGALRGNGTELFQILSKPRSRPILAGVTPEALGCVLARVGEIERALPRADGVVAREVAHVVAMLRAACHRGIALLEGGLSQGEVRRSLAGELDDVMASHASVWRLRNREGGLADSLARFAAVRAEYGP
jgi:hypothetical protein